MKVVNINLERVKRQINKNYSYVCPKCQEKTVVATINSLKLDDILVKNVRYKTCFHCFYECVDEDLMHSINQFLKSENIQKEFTIPMTFYKKPSFE